MGFGGYRRQGTRDICHFPTISNLLSLESIVSIYYFVSMFSSFFHYHKVRHVWLPGAEYVGRGLGEESMGVSKIEEVGGPWA